MSLQSRFVGCGEGESRRKNSYGDSLPLVECAADASFVRNLSKHRRIPRSPAECFHPSSPLLRCDGTEAGDGSAVSAILTSAVSLSFQGRGWRWRMAAAEVTDGRGDRLQR